MPSPQLALSSSTHSHCNDDAFDEDVINVS